MRLSRGVVQSTATFFRDHLFLTHSRESKRIAVAVSGGVDSMLLTAMLSHPSMSHVVGDIHCVTVDHGMRPESGQEAQWVARAVRGMPPQHHRVRHCVLTGAAHGYPVSSSEEQARSMRYQLLSRYCAERNITHLVLAHHPQDQAETVLLRMARASGLSGLAGMSSSSFSPTLGIRVVRPLLVDGDNGRLFSSKQRILDVANYYDVPFVEDPSNRSDQFTRNVLRKVLMGDEELTQALLCVSDFSREWDRHLHEEVLDLAQRACLVFLDDGVGASVRIDLHLLFGAPAYVREQLVVQAARFVRGGSGSVRSSSVRSALTFLRHRYEHRRWQFALLQHYDNNTSNYAVPLRAVFLGLGKDLVLSGGTDKQDMPRPS